LRALLDTHAFLWWYVTDRKMSSRAREFIADDRNELFLSAASVWEIATKFRIGKLPDAADFVSDFADVMQKQGIGGLDVSVAHAHRAGLLPEPIRDPFDRMIIAQAQAEDLTLVSNERAFDAYGIRRVW
jgi:PIN domain nuclease of toxin-antitoxin system